MQDLGIPRSVLQLIAYPTRFDSRAARALLEPAGIRVPRAVGDFLILRAVRESGGKALAVGDPAILKAVDDCARRDGLLLCPEGGATLAAYRHALRDGEVDADEEVVLFNCATGLKYPLPRASATLDRHQVIDFEAL